MKKEVSWDELTALQRRESFSIRIEKERFSEWIEWRAILLKEISGLYRAAVEADSYSIEDFDGLSLVTRDGRYFLVRDDRLLRAVDRSDADEVLGLLREQIDEEAYFISSRVISVGISELRGEPFDGSVSFRYALAKRPEVVEAFLKEKPDVVSSLSVYDVGGLIIEIVKGLTEGKEDESLKSRLRFFLLQLKKEDFLKMFEREEPSEYFSYATPALKRVGSLIFGEDLPEKWRAFREEADFEGEFLKKTEKEFEYLAKAYNRDVQAFSRFSQLVFPHKARKKPKKGRAL